MSHLIGRIHSIETCGTVDGPGIRFVIFLQGCALRCLYCHNPDTRESKTPQTREMHVEELFQEILKYRSFFEASGGGVTFSGGEPLLQSEFVFELAEACAQVGIHTAIDTSGFPTLHQQHVRKALDISNLVLLDIKSIRADVYKKLTSVDLEPTLEMARYLSKKKHPTWIRYVLVPGWTDAPQDIEALAQFLLTLKNIEKVQVLPFHKMGEFKWKQLGFRYLLSNLSPPSAESIQQALRIFQSAGFKAE